MKQCVALIRGINVGRAKRIAMADLRAMVQELGHYDVRTLLNSGNVVFRSARPRMTAVADELEAAISRKFGISARVIVVDATELNAIVRDDPLHSVVSDPARYVVAFGAPRTVLAESRSMLQQSWAPEAFALGARAAYLWCADGIADSKLVKAFSRVAGDTITTRNWTTVLKLLR
jgi:uncharacterized protein (DUF1697 family)